MHRVDDAIHGIEASQDHDDKEKREERREKSEERREKKEEKRDTKTDRQRSPNEAARGGGRPFSQPSRPLGGPLAASRAEGREQRKDRREQKKQKTHFLLFCVECGRGVSQGFRKRIPVLMARGGGLRAKKGDVLGHPTLKNPLFSSRKTSIFAKRPYFWRLNRILHDKL